MLKAVVPTRTIALLMFIGFADLISTSWLHSLGLIRELNPIMRPMLEHGELPFILVKGATLVVAWVALAMYARRDLKFVRFAATAGSLVYLFVWGGWFLAAR